MNILLFRSCSVQQLQLIIEKLKKKYNDLNIDLVLQKSTIDVQSLYNFKQTCLIENGKFNFFKQGLSLIPLIFK